MFTTVSLVFFSIAGLIENPVLPIAVTAPWTITVGPGNFLYEGKDIAVTEALSFTIAAPDRIRVQNERYDTAPPFNPKAGGWLCGARLRPLIAEECSATGALLPETFQLKSAPEATPYGRDTDYAVNPLWATFGRLEGGAIPADQPVYADYEYEYSRLDSIVMDDSGHLTLLTGVPAPALALPPVPAEKERAVLNIFVPAGCRALTEESLFPIETTPYTPAHKGEAEQYCPKTVKKLRDGQPVTIVAFGDSVTNGGGVGDRKELWYQHVFARRLQQQFPKAPVTMLTAAWPGGNSRGYMDAPAGSIHDFQRDVLDPHPDLVTIEFVNDAYLDEEGVQKQYREILDKISAAGAEVILITPHLVRPDWLTTSTLKFDEDPRAYVKGLRRFSGEQQVALADASLLWCRLYRQGIPYTTLLANAINHPDARGQALFADALMALFPEK